MAWPAYAAKYVNSKSLLVRLWCRSCHQPRYALPSKEDWVKDDRTVSAKCLKCGHAQNDSYNWERC